MEMEVEILGVSKGMEGESGNIGIQDKVGKEMYRIKLRHLPNILQGQTKFILITRYLFPERLLINISCLFFHIGTSNESGEVR